MKRNAILGTAAALVAAFACRGTPPTPPPGSVRGEAPVAREPAPEVRRVPAEPREAAVSAMAQEPRELLEQEAERVRLRQEKAAALAAEYLARGREAFDRADFRDALAEFAQALDVDPGNAEARTWLRRTEAVLGERGASAAEFFEDAQRREAVRRAEALLAAEQAVLEGDAAAREGHPEDALGRYREALVILRYHPLVGTDALSERAVLDKIERTVVARDAAERERAAEQERRAEEERMRREREERQARVERLRNLLREANASFAAERFRQAEGLLDQALALDPENVQARELRAIVVDARHEATDRRLRRTFREAWQKTFLELDTMDVPQSETIVHDLKRWAEVSERTPRELRPDPAPTAAEEEEIRRRLEDTVVPVRFEEVGIGEIAAFLQNVTGVNFVLSRMVREEVPEEEKTVRLPELERPVARILDVIAELTPLRWRVRSGVVQIVHRDEMKGGQVLQFYEVRDLVAPVTDFPAPEINLTPSGAAPPAPEEPEPREFLVINADKLVELIRSNISPASWTEDEKNTISYQQGTLVVSQSPEVQEQIQALLEDLREATGILVDIQARFLKVEDSFLEDIGIDFRGLGDDTGGQGVPGKGTNAPFDDFGPPPGSPLSPPDEIGTKHDAGAFYTVGDDDLRARTENLFDLGLGGSSGLSPSGGLSLQYTLLDDLQLELVLRAVRKSQRVEEVTAPHLLVFNTERANLRVMNQVSYVKDFDVEIAQAAAIGDPIVDVANDGVFLDVRPVVSADRKFITMELRPTVAVLKRPIFEFQTSLGIGSPVTIQLPEVEVQRARTTVSMPDGSTLVLGGLKISEKQDFRSGVPIFSKIPLLSALFERKGKTSSQRKILILLRAKIVIPTEHEPRPSASSR